CQRQTVGQTSFNPCPVTNYLDGGWGFINTLKQQRGVLSVAGTYFAHLGGLHALKLGADFEDNIYEDNGHYSGGAVYRVKTNGVVSRKSFATATTDSMGNQVPTLLPNGGIAQSSTLNEALYL